jgi:hypothetical protein
VNRAARRAGKCVPPPGYVTTVDRLDRLVGMMLEAKMDLRFAFPPKEIALVAGLDQIGARLARSEDAHAFIRLVVDRIWAGEHRAKIPTANMLARVLEVRGIAIQRVPLAEIGIMLGGGLS